MYYTWLRQYQRLYKAMFHKYATISVNKATLKAITFDDMKEQRQTMNLGEVFRFLNDFEMNKKFNMRREDVKRLIKLINHQQDGPPVKSTNDLDMFGFMEFILQVAHFTSGQLDRPSEFLPLLFRHFKEVSLASSKPLFQRLFEDPLSQSIADHQLVKELTRKVNEDPDYEVPPGFIKKNVEVTVERYSSGATPAAQICSEILDDLFFSLFGTHLLNPQATLEKQWVVKPEVFLHKKLTARSPLKAGDRPVKLNLPLLDAKSPELAMLKSELKKARHLQSLPRLDSLVAVAEGNPFQKKIPVAQRGSSRQAAAGAWNDDRELHNTLKIQLLRRRNDPLRDNLREAAYVLDGVIRAVENGADELSPRSKQRIYGKQPNLAELMRKVKAKREADQKEEREKQF